MLIDRLAERGVHAALLYLLHGDARHGALAREIALSTAMRDGYPNIDNVLGPTRLFFFESGSATLHDR